MLIGVKTCAGDEKRAPSGQIRTSNALPMSAIANMKSGDNCHLSSTMEKDVEHPGACGRHRIVIKWSVPPARWERTEMTGISPRQKTPPQSLELKLHTVYASKRKRMSTRRFQ